MDSFSTDLKFPTFAQFWSKKSTPSSLFIISATLGCVVLALTYVLVANWLSIKQIFVRTGLSISRGQFPTLSNTGVLSLSEGDGITLSGNNHTRTISNSGVLTVAAGTGCTNGGTAQNRVINCSGLQGTSVSAITVTGSNSTSGTVNLKNGACTTITPSGQNISINATAPSPTVLPSGVFDVEDGLSIQKIHISGLAGTGLVNLRYINAFSPPVYITAAVVAYDQSVDVMVGGGDRGQGRTGDKIIWSVAKMS